MLQKTIERLYRIHNGNFINVLRALTEEGWSLKNGLVATVTIDTLMTLSNAKVKEIYQLKWHELYQCPTACDHMHTCNNIVHCDHALPHEHTKDCIGLCEVAVAVLM